MSPRGALRSVRGDCGLIAADALGGTDHLYAFAVLVDSVRLVPCDEE